MSNGKNDSGSYVTSIRDREYNAVSGTRHRSVGGIRRLVFFGLASIWGFIVGVGGLLAAMSAVGRPAHPGFGVIPGLLPALIIAVAGGFVIAAAYRESKRHSR